MNGIGIAGVWSAPIRRSFDQAVEIEGVGVAQLAVDGANPPIDNGTPQGPRHRSRNVRQQDLGAVRGHAAPAVPVNDGPQVQTNERSVIGFQRRQLRFGIKIRWQWLQQKIDQRRAAILAGTVGRVRCRPHAGLRVLKFWQLRGSVLRRGVVTAANRGLFAVHLVVHHPHHPGWLLFGHG